jgi:hypothetical protein
LAQQGDTLVCGGAADLAFIDDKAGPQQKLGAHPFAAGGQHLAGKAAAVLEAAAPGCRQPVGQRADHLVKQMAVDLQLYPIKTGSLHPFARIGEIGDHPLDIPILDDLGHMTMRRLARGAGAKHRQPVSLVPAGAIAEMGQLDHHRRPLFMYIVAEFAHPAHHLVLPGEQIAESRGRVTADTGRACGHHHGNAALGPGEVIAAIAILCAGADASAERVGAGGLLTRGQNLRTLEQGSGLALC